MTTATLTLSEFLLARLDEDEAAAQRVFTYDEVAGALGVAAHDMADPSEEAFAARWTPARVLADVAAKRAVVEGITRFRTEAEKAEFDSPFRLSGVSIAVGLEVAVKLLAQPYHDHPDWKPEWTTLVARP